jgi:hypothetical protein
MFCGAEAEYRLDNFIRDVGLGQTSDRNLGGLLDMDASLSRGHPPASGRRLYPYVLSDRMSGLLCPLRGSSTEQKTAHPIFPQNDLYCEKTTGPGHLAGDPVYSRLFQR